MTDTASSPHTNHDECYWCREPITPKVQFCASCGRPLKWKAYIFASIKIVLIPILVSIILVYAAKSIDQVNRETQSRSEERVALAKSYIDLAENISKFRDVLMRISSACRGSEERCYEKLHPTVLDLDHIIARIGPQLAPFTEYADRKLIDTQMIKVWEFCFVLPYFRGGFGEPSLSRQLHEIFDSNLCGPERCTSDAGRAAQSIVHRIWSGCIAKQPELNQSMDWLLREASSMFHRDNPLNPEDHIRLQEVSNPIHTIWNHFNAKEFEKTIERASQYASSREEEARTQARRLTNAQSKVRPVGRVSRLLRNVIFADDDLNDVATCYLIFGWAALKLDRIEEARSAFQIVLGFPQARTWDPVERWFWSPSEAAKKELEKLR